MSKKLYLNYINYLSKLDWMAMSLGMSGNFIKKNLQSPNAIVFYTAGFMIAITYNNILLYITIYSSIDTMNCEKT